MSCRLVGFALAALLAGVAVPARGQAPDLNVISKVQLMDGAGAVEIVGSKRPNFTTFSMSEPARLVIDIAEAVFQPGLTEKPVAGGGVVSAIKLASYGSDSSAIARVIITLSRDVETDLQASGETTLLVKLAGPAAVAQAEAPDVEAAAQASQPTAASEAERRTEEQKRQAAAKKADEEAARAAAEAQKRQAEEQQRQLAAKKAQEDAARAAAEAQQRQAEEQRQLAAKKKAEQEAARAAAAEAQKRQAEEQRLAAAKQKAEADAARVAAAEAQKRQAEEQRLLAAKKKAEDEAARAAAAEAQKRQAEEQRLLAAKKKAEEEAARAAAEQQKRQIEEERLRQLAAKKQAEQEARAMAEQQKRQADEERQRQIEARQAERDTARAQRQAAASQQDEEDRGLVESEAAGAAGRGGKVELIGFKQLAEGSRVFVRTSRPVPFSVSEGEPGVIVLELPETSIGKKNNLRFLDTSFFETPVALVAPRVAGGSVRVEIRLKSQSPYAARQDGQDIFVDFRSPDGLGHATALPVEDE